jgi:acetyltransferase-like isoleucine patch superfamily enzyme
MESFIAQLSCIIEKYNVSTSSFDQSSSDPFASQFQIEVGNNVTNNNSCHYDNARHGNYIYINYNIYIYYNI